jgi:hypothetical protein
LLLLIFYFCKQASLIILAKLKATKPMNKGNKAAPKKTVSVAALALLPQGEQYAPCEAKRRHLAGTTPYHPSAYVSILAGSNSDDEHAEGQEEDIYALVDATRDEFTPPNKKARKGAGRPCHMYVQVGRYGGVVMWCRISPVPHGVYAFLNGDAEFKGRAIREWFDGGKHKH